MELHCSRMSSRAFYRCRQVSVAAYIRKFENLLQRNSTVLYFRTPLGPANLVVQNLGRDRSESVGWPVNSTPFTEAYRQQPANGSYCKYMNPVNTLFLSLRLALTLSSHLHPCLPSGLFIQGFPTKLLYFPLSLSDIPHVWSI
jgi:hypothetical protein